MRFGREIANILMGQEISFEQPGMCIKNSMGITGGHAFVPGGKGYKDNC